jgi:hypothetical protein
VSPLPAPVFELVLAPLASGASLVHASRALGPRRAALEFLALGVYGYALERAAIAVFASHDYGGAWLMAPGGVPLAVAACWAAVILSAVAVAARLGLRRPAAIAAGAALVGLSLDLLMEPVAVRSGLWRWTPPAPWLDVPVGNFVGWAVIVGSYVLGALRLGDSAHPVGHALRRLLLGALSIAALVAVGLVWTRLGAERLFDAGRGNLVAAAVFGTLAALALRAHPGVPGAEDFAGRLAVAGRPWAPAIIAAGFAANAILLGDPRLVLLAAASLLALGFALAK